MKSFYKTVFLIFLFSMPVLSLEVDINEIKNVKSVKFNNYRGSHNNPDSVNQIFDIGRILADKSENAASGKRVTFNYKYSIIHAVQEGETKKYSADIFVIHRNAKVDHIRNVRRILAGYFQKKYNYSAKNAMTLAIYTTYYNAVYRGNLEYLSGKYKPLVIQNISKNNAGIALSYKEWPGKTRMVIPLTEDSVRGTLDKVNPAELADEKVREEVRKDLDNVDTQKDIVKMQEKEVENDKERLKQDKKEVEEQKEDIKEKKEEIEQQKEQLKEDKEEVEKITDPEKKEEKQKEIKEKEDEIKDQEKQVAEEEKNVENKENKIEEQEKRIEDKETKIEEQKKEIEKDEIKKGIEEGDPDVVEKIEEKQTELEEKEKELERREDELKNKDADDNRVGENLYYMRIREYTRNGHYNNDMYLIDAGTMQVVLKSEVTNISGSKYVAFSGGVVVITRKPDGYAEHNLTLLNTDTLKAEYTGTENIFWRSFIEVRGDYIYAIVKKDGKYYLGKFDKTLKLQSISLEAVHEDSFISFYNNYVYINNFDKKIMVLNLEDLKFIKLVIGDL